MPRLFMIGGPNGAGKTTSAMGLLPDEINCAEFVNADSIAAGLSPFRAEAVSFEAGRLMLRRIHELADRGVDFAFETTMASRSFAPFLDECRDRGYSIHLIYLSLKSPDIAVARVAARAKNGGHVVPEEIIHRRYLAGLRNFVHLYIPLADGWTCYDNSGKQPSLVARKDPDLDIEVTDPFVWEKLQEAAQ